MLKFLVLTGVILCFVRVPVSAQGTAATGSQGGYRSSRSWQSAYPQSIAGRDDAGLGQTFATRGSSSASQLPSCNTGLNAILSGFNRAPVRQFGSGGFSGGGARPYTGCYRSGTSGGSLPPCAMTPCDFDVAEVGGTSGGSNGGNSNGGGGGDPYGYHQGGDGNGSGSDPYGFHQGDGGTGSGGVDNYGFHQGGSGIGGDPYGYHGGN